MKIMTTLLTLFVLFLPTTPAQEYTQWHLPEGAVARFGKSFINEIQYSPDGTQLAVATSIGIWLYDTATYHEVTLLTGTYVGGLKRSVQSRWKDACQWESRQYRDVVGSCDR